MLYVPSIHEVVEDVDAALERFDRASSPAHQRRAMREALAHLYFLHQHRLHQKPEAFSRAVAVPGRGGDVTQGVIYARGKLAHHVTREMGPDLQGGAFDPATFALDAFDCGTLTWLHVAEMTPEDGADFVKVEGKGKHAPVNLEHYRQAVAGPSRCGTPWPPRGISS